MINTIIPQGQAIIEKDGKILLVKEARQKKLDAEKWNQPAGWIEVGENPIDSVSREVQEETGYKFTPKAVLGIYSLVREDLFKIDKNLRHPIKIIFIGEISKEKVGELEKDVSEAKWFFPEEIKNMDKNTLRDLDIKKEVKDYFAGKKYPLDLITHTVAE